MKKRKIHIFSLVIFSMLSFAVERAQASDSEWKPARVIGRILSILKREGEPVKEGDFLYSISSGECVALREEKRVAEKRSIAELITSADRREKQLGIKLVEDKCMIVATHDGVLTKRNLESGAVFNVGDVLATVLDVGHLGIEIDIPEQDHSKVKIGEKISFQFSSRPERKFTGRIQTIVPAIDQVTRSVKARLTSMILPGDTSLDSLIYGEIDNGKHESTLTVPASALVFHHNQQYVVGGNPANPKAIPVQVISEANATVSIRPIHEEALKAGDSIATKGAIFLFQKIKNEG
jgi:multidrug efflux pump subunit AcrA (membrane-fusion protein)